MYLLNSILHFLKFNLTYLKLHVTFDEIFIREDYFQIK